ncbi:hypothetical protein CDD80_3128 [Ophiocordyceps camponoti-rufipedis]|uniref:Uncharacterized protein n=1 Tax=Ophiocordyceps camponoti-rufipedis TaxID=2004952 RepID=A0A2C5XWE1_9HYPO|nr:hypothetical protein CDD80_3128 [Ophiocordyceps camponoti-rufipedis]
MAETPSPTVPQLPQPLETPAELSDDNAMLLSILNSPFYAPTALNDLPQPRPNDLPDEYDPFPFHFRDALEDLILASQGLPLLDIYYHIAQTQLLARIFPMGEPGWFYTRRLQTLLVPPQDRPPQLESRWESFHRQLDYSAPEVWGSSAAAEKQQVQGNDSDARSPNRKDDARLAPSNANGTALRLSPLDLLGVLFSPVSAIVSETKKACNGVIESLSGAKQSAVVDSGRSSSDGKITYDARGLRVVEKVQRHHEDAQGFRKTIEVRSMIDADGNEFLTQTTVAVVPLEAYEDGWELFDDDSKREDSNREDSDQQSKKQGWFWKK